MFNILSHKGNTNQNYIEIPFHPRHNGNHQNQTTTNAGKHAGGEGKESLYSVRGIEIRAAAMEISMEVPQKKKY
jgi:hypothetical protein